MTLDLMMPGLGGIEAFEKIREMDAEVQIVIVSGGSRDDLVHALPQGLIALLGRNFLRKVTLVYDGPAGLFTLL